MSDSIYNEYGALKGEYRDLFFNTVELKEIFNLIMNIFADYPLPIQRELFNYFLSGLERRFAEYVLGEAIKMRREERKK